MGISKAKYVYAVMVMAFGSDVFAEIAHTFGTGSNQFTMTFVPIGSPGNIPDTTGNPNPAGAVSYNYSMGKYEVSEDMITKFNASQSLQITKETRGPDMPASSVSWNESARFVNWLNTSTGGFAAYKFTSSGVNDNIALWTPAETLDYNAANPFRSLRANYVLPSMDEWYKAAYYDPNTSTYYDYPTGSNSAPTIVTGGTSPGTAVYFNQPYDGPANVNNAGGLSPFGVMGLGGNVFEWQETADDLVNNSPAERRRSRGGNWVGNYTYLLSSTDEFSLSTDGQNDGWGFRVAAVPEPSSILGSVSLGLGGLMYRRKRRAKNS